MLSFNDTSVKAVKFTGKDINNTAVTNKNLTDIVCNGTHVWCTPPSIGTTHRVASAMNMDTKVTYYTIYLRVANNSTKSVKYTFSCPQLGISKKSHTLNAEHNCEVSFDLGTLKPSSVAGSWMVTYLGDTVSCVTTQAL